MVWTAYKTPKQCRNCDAESWNYCNGLCVRCYKYQKSHDGEMRPERLWKRYPGYGSCNRCKICDVHLITGLCDACYKYQRRHRIPRPAKLWQRPMNCLICGHRPRTPNTLRNGLCHKHSMQAWRKQKKLQIG